MKLQTRQRGMALLETMLVLALAASLIVFAVKVYKQFQFQANTQKIAATVNQLFQASSGYYFANCRMTLDSDSNRQSTGALDPLVMDVSDFLVIPIQATLVAEGFITAWQPTNPLVDNSPTDKGYIVQVNRVLTAGGVDPVMNVYACTGSTPSPSCDVTSSVALESSDTTPVSQSRVVTFAIQVAVKLSSALTPAERTQLKNNLNADCLSSASGSGVAPCKTSHTVADYLVWTRMPSSYNPNITSDYWISTPYVKQFNMQYTNDGMAALSGVKNETRDWYNTLNYLCGG